MMKGAVASQRGGDATPSQRSVALKADDETLRFDGLPSVRGAPGIAASEFVLPEDFDSDDEMIADLFEGQQRSKTTWNHTSLPCNTRA